MKSVKLTSSQFSSFREFISSSFSFPSIRVASHSGYVRVGQYVVSLYNGRYGFGFTVDSHSYVSSSFFQREYYIFSELSDWYSFCEYFKSLCI